MAELEDVQPQPGGVELSLLDILLVLARNRRLLLTVTAVFVFVATLVAFLLPATYTATTSFLPPQQTSSSSTMLSQLGGLGSLASLGGIAGLKSPSDLYVGLLKSHTVEDAMIRRYNLQQEYKGRRFSETRVALENHVKIDGSAKDGLIRISVESNRPERAAELANGYLDQYRGLSASLAIGEASQRRLFLEQQLQQTKSNLVTAEEQLKQTEQTRGLIQLDAQARALIESAASLRGQVAAKEVQVQSMRTYASGGNAALIMAQQELSELRAQLAKLGGVGGSSSEMVIPKGQIPEVGLEYVRKIREVKYNETIFEILARQYEAAKLDEAREGSLVQVVDKAYPPDRKSWPSKRLIVLAGALLGLICASVWVLVREAFRFLYTVPEYSAKLRELGSLTRSLK